MKSFCYSKPFHELSTLEQLNECLRSIGQIAYSEGCFILKMSFFIDASSEKEFCQLRNLIFC